MAMLIMIIAKTLDISLIAAAVITFFWRSWKFVPIAAIGSAIVSETLLSLVSIGHLWGSSIILAVLAGLVQSAIFYLIFDNIKKRTAPISQQTKA